LGRQKDRPTIFLPKLFNRLTCGAARAGLKFVAYCYWLKTVIMKRALVIILFVMALALLGYAIYRSTAVRKTYVTQTGREVTYGEPQHGLILGLCILAGLCIVSTIPLLLDRRGDVFDDRDALSRRTL